jgi:hypothetical protein
VAVVPGHRPHNTWKMTGSRDMHACCTCRLHPRNTTQTPCHHVSEERPVSHGRRLLDRQVKHQAQRMEAVPLLVFGMDPLPTGRCPSCYSSVSWLRGSSLLQAREQTCLPGELPANTAICVHKARCEGRWMLHLNSRTQDSSESPSHVHNGRTLHRGLAHTFRRAAWHASDAEGNSASTSTLLSRSM